MKKTRIMGLLLVLVLVTSCFAGGTFAKYTSQATGSDEANVAKWSIKVEGDEIAVTPEIDTVKFNLFSTINDTKTPAADETDVSDDLIAPGTCGDFAFTIKNDSQVTAKYSIVFEETNNTSNIPLQYSTNNVDWTTDLESLEIKNDNVAIGATVTSGKIYWKWAFDADAVTSVGNYQTEEKDTALGIAAQTVAPKIIITATITATQVD